MQKVKDQNTRYYIDIDLESKKVIRFDYDQREKLVLEKLQYPEVRIYITKGQFNKLVS